MTPHSVPEFHYRLPGLASGASPGAHRSQQGEGGFELRASVPISRARDIRRLDLQASLRDPFGEWAVRQFSQRLALTVVLVADVSASMAFAGGQSTPASPASPAFTGPPPRQQVLADLADSLAASAWRHGDRFGLVGCDSQVCADLLLPPSRSRGAGLALAARLRGRAFTGASAAGLLQAWRHLPRQRALVFLVSDFQAPLAHTTAVLASLAHHAVVPVVLCQVQEAGPAARHGLLQLQDPETGQQRHLWWRPALRAQLASQYLQRRAALQQCFAAQRLRPLLVSGGFDADAMTRYFQA